LSGSYFAARNVNKRRQARREAEAKAEGAHHKVMRYGARKVINDDFVKEFVVTNPQGPMHVESPGPDGQPLLWPCHDEDGCRVFTAPDGYTGGPWLWVHDLSVPTEALVWEGTTLYGLAE